ncbi:FAD binding domain-containing protein [Acidithiobacillus sulfuriphilus]|uniref:FAD binding domain-containing protein n=1 Tax=Acidithiobacillus sulfuriphilus TaxID=1867749 RepID=UPI003F5EE447
MSEWTRPRHLSEALDILALDPGKYRVISGGTDLMVESHLAPDRRPAYWLDISGIPELQDVVITEQGIRIGAATPLGLIRHHPEVVARWPMLAASAAVTGAPPIQNRATLGGNICNASPAADNSPVLLAYGARLEISQQKESRILPYEAFHKSYRATALQAGELLTAIWIPYPGNRSRSYFRKVGTRAAQAIAKVSIAALIEETRDGSIRRACFGLASVAAMPCTLPSVSRYLAGRLFGEISEAAVRHFVQEDIAPIKDIRSTAEYRLEVASRLVLEAIRMRSEIEKEDM